MLQRLLYTERYAYVMNWTMHIQENHFWRIVSQGKRNEEEKLLVKKLTDHGRNYHRQMTNVLCMQGPSPTIVVVSPRDLF